METGDLENQPADQLPDSHGGTIIAEDKPSEDDGRLRTGKLRRIRDFISKHVEYRADQKPPKDGYSSHLFDRLEKPLPIKDIFFRTKLLICARGIFQGSIIWSITYYFIVFSLGVPIIFAALLLLPFQLKGICRVGPVPIPSLLQLLSLHRWPQWAWVRESRAQIYVC
jgi:hypothetical protein